MTPQAAMANERHSLRPACSMFTHVVMHNLPNGKQAFYFYANVFTTRKPETVVPTFVGREAASPIVINGVQVPLPSSRPKKLISALHRPTASAVLLKRWATKMATWLVNPDENNDPKFERGIPLSTIINPTEDETARMCTLTIPKGRDEDINNLLLELAEMLSNHGCRCVIRSATIRILLARAPTLADRMKFQQTCLEYGKRKMTFWYDTTLPMTPTERIEERKKKEELRQIEMSEGHFAILSTTLAEEQIDVPLVKTLSKLLKFTATFNKMEGSSTCVRFANAADKGVALAYSLQRQLGPFMLTSWQPSV